MSLTQLNQQATQLPDSERKELIGFLVEQGRSQKESSEMKRTFAEMIDDKDPANWVELSELKKRFKD